MTFPPANFDPSIDPTADQLRALRDAGPDGPVDEGGQNSYAPAR